MVEHYTKAVVLSREPRGELDAALTLYTKDFGKIVAKVKSIRRITSKLSGHLTTGAVANIRVVERNGNGYQLVDALSSRVMVTLDLLRFLDFINKLTPLGVADLHLWHELESTLHEDSLNKANYRRIISIMGYDAKNAFCDNCGGRQIAYFLPHDIMFLCGRCFYSSGIKENEAFSI
ncbi:MAG: hypothetical protein AUJ39_00810 [Parcubacteria group bacterium CG1_02_42_13]|nr:MAG: hypothetical protein AUJ39_00810 [Parcubacteria group bacterium CG1_02_42_13]